MVKKNLFTGFTTTLFLIILIINCVIGYYSNAINSQLIIISFFATCVITYVNVILFKKTLRYQMSALLTSLLALIILVMITFSQSPRYTYIEAKDIVVNDLTDDSTFKYIDSSTKTIRSAQNLNFFINKGYVIHLLVNEESKSFFFNPINGNYIEILENVNITFSNQSVEKPPFF